MNDRENQSGKDADEGTLRRWSRLKTQAKEEQDAGAEPDILESGDAGSQVPVPAEDGSEEVSEDDFVLEDLPDIETLDKDSDYTPFLHVKVPAELRRLALRKLWTSDPVLAVLDGLNDYDEDYSALGMVAEKVSTLYKPGEGMPGPEPEQDQPEPENPQSSADEPEEVANAGDGDNDNAGDGDDDNAGDGDDDNDNGENPETPEAGSGESEAPEEDPTAGAQIADDEGDPEKTTE